MLHEQHEIKIHTKTGGITHMRYNVAEIHQIKRGQNNGLGSHKTILISQLRVWEYSGTSSCSFKGAVWEVIILLDFTVKFLNTALFLRVACVCILALG